MDTEEVKHIDLNHDLTQTDLVNLLNKKFGGKSFTTKKNEEIEPFNAQDIQGYVGRKKLPNKYGGNVIKVIKNHGSALVLLRVKDINKIMSKPDFELK